MSDKAESTNMTTSTHKCEVVPVVLTQHPNADTLSVVHVFGYTVCVRTEDWKTKTKGAYVVPDSLVDTQRPEFSFLAGPNQPDPFHRVKVKKLRGIFSQGLLVPVSDDIQIGVDLADQLGVVRYNPQDITTFSDFEVGPSSDTVSKLKYDLDSFYRYAHEVFVLSEPVYVTEKIDGSNAFYCWLEDRMWVASRSGFKKSDPRSVWWIALNRHPEITEWCKTHPGYRLYGEVYGNNSKMHYGHKQPKVIRFAAFDIMTPSGNWLDPISAREIAPNIPWVPTVSDKYEFNIDKLIELSNGTTLINNANHIREGIVIEPLVPRWHESCGRVKLKIVSNTYLEKS